MLHQTSRLVAHRHDASYHYYQYARAPWGRGVCAGGPRYVCVCMYAYVCMCMYVCMCVNECVSIYVCTYLSMFVDAICVGIEYTVVCRHPCLHDIHVPGIVTG